MLPPKMRPNCKCDYVMPPLSVIAYKNTVLDRAGRYIEKNLDNSCRCQSCLTACTRRPGWFTPKEAKRIIKLGFGNRLMLDYWVEFPNDILILSPAIDHFCGEKAPYWPEGRCTFFNKNEMCEIHNTGSKPLECRALHAPKGSKDNQDARTGIIELWKKRFGKEVVRDWKRHFFKEV